MTWQVVTTGVRIESYGGWPHGFQPLVKTPTNYVHYFTKVREGGAPDGAPHWNHVYEWYRDWTGGWPRIGAFGGSRVSAHGSGADGLNNLAAAQYWDGLCVFWQAFSPPGGERWLPGGHLPTTWAVHLRWASRRDGAEEWTQRGVLDGHNPELGRRIDGDLGDAVVALGNDDAIHVFYKSPVGLRHAWRLRREPIPADDSRYWYYETVGGDTSYRPVAVPRQGGAISVLWGDQHGVLDAPNTTTFPATPGAWTIREKYNPIGRIEHLSSVAAVEWNDSLHVFYYRGFVNTPGIFHGERDAAGWHHELWLPNRSPAGIAAAAYGDAIHVLYGNCADGTLEYACYRPQQPPRPQRVDDGFVPHFSGPNPDPLTPLPFSDTLNPSAYVLGKEVRVMYAIRPRRRLAEGRSVQEAFYRPLPRVHIEAFAATPHVFVFVPSVLIRLRSARQFWVSATLTVRAGAGAEHVVVTEDPYNLGAVVGDWQERQLNSNPPSAVVGFWLGRTLDGTNLAVSNGPFTFRLVVTDANGQQSEAETAVNIQWRSGRIECVTRAPDEAPTRALQGFGGRRGGFLWRLTREELIGEIRRGERFFVERPDGNRVDVVIARTDDGFEYVRTTADGTEPNNLLNLPDC
jgi:hypothetical protein